VRQAEVGGTGLKEGEREHADDRLCRLRARTRRIADAGDQKAKERQSRPDIDIGSRQERLEKKLNLRVRGQGDRGEASGGKQGFIHLADITVEHSINPRLHPPAFSLSLLPDLPISVQLGYFARCSPRASPPPSPRAYSLLMSVDGDDP